MLASAVRLPDLLRRQPGALVLVEGFALVALIGGLDHVTSWDVSLFVFYAFPILFVAWYGGRAAAILCAVVCGFVWYFANTDTQNYSTFQGYLLAASNRLVYFLFVAIGGTAMKQQREEMRARLEAILRTRELEQEIVRVSEREQMRIGQDLHDGLCQNLVAIDCAAACLRADLEAREVPEADAAAVIQALLQEAVVEARNIARGIFPVQMDADGLPTALQELVDMTNNLRQIPTFLQVSGDVQIDDPQIAMHLYRIAQQALNNALQHSGASQIVIDLESSDGVLAMTVIDNGAGIESDAASSPGMGLRTMHYRARKIGAELEVESLAEGGTQVRCTFPLFHALHA